MKKLAILVLAAGVCCSAAFADELFGVIGAGGPGERNGLYRVNITDASITFVDNLTHIPGGGGTALGTDPNTNLLYHTAGFDDDPATDRIFESYNLSTGVLTNIPLTPNLLDESKGLTWDSRRGLFLETSRGPNTFRTLTTGGLETVIGTPVFNNAGLAFSGATLYGADINDQQMHRLDPANGSSLEMIPITIPGLASPGFTALATDPDTGIMYAVTRAVDGFDDRHLVTVDPTTGTGVDIGNLEHRFAGLAFAVPEPGTLVLLLVAAPLLLRRR